MGVRDYTFAPQGVNAIVKADNGVGKTTLFSAFLWLLFNKDAAGRTDFEIKPLDAESNPLHGLDHMVEAVLDVDGKEVRLCKVYKEKWTKKRGQTTKTLTGHTTDYYVDGVPVKKKEWEQKINGLIEEETFRLLTNPAYFAGLHWQRRRQILLQVCGDVSDEEVINSNSDLSALPEILGDRSLEDHRKAVQSRQREINNRLQEIPSRIDELQRSISEAEELSRRIVKDNIKELEQKLEGMKSSGKDPEVAREREALEKELRELKKAWQQEHDQQREDLRQKVRGLSDDLDQHKRELRQNKSRQEELNSSISDKQKRMETLRQEFQELQVPEVEDTCPTCGQAIPEDQVEQTRAEGKKKVATRKKQIQAEGKKLKEQVEEEQTELEALQAKAQAIEEVLPSKEQDLKDKEAEHETLRNQVEDPDGDRRQRRAQIEERLEEIREIENSTEAPDTTEVEQQLEAERAKLSKIEAAQQTKDRIQELRDEERSLAEEYEKLQQQVHLMERFITTKTDLLESRINSYFNLARFRLFEEQVDGGINPTCEILYQGVPYGHGLNRGAQANVGLDIIRTLSEHYQVWAPVFVDNAETVTELVDPGTQCIKMMVAPGVDQLHVELENQEAIANE
jgi:DNA repair exonuclease SbcCD ATPase subunit